MHYLIVNAPVIITQYCKQLLLPNIVSYYYHPVLIATITQYCYLLLPSILATITQYC